MVRDIDENRNFEIKISDEVEQKVEQEKSSNHNEREVPTNDEVSQEKEHESSEEILYLNQLQRLQAEFANYKKRVEKERLELSDLFKSELVSSLLPVIDDFERMLDHTNDENNEFLKGLKLIYQKLIDILEDQGLKSIKSVGQKFDPALHEAVITESNEDGEDEIVAEEWRKGYLFNDRLLRPAQVKVWKSDKADEN